MVLICISLMANDVEHFFHVSVRSLYVFFVEVSLHVFCPFLDWIIWFLGVEFEKFFVDLGYQLVLDLTESCTMLKASFSQGAF